MRKTLTLGLIFLCGLLFAQETPEIGIINDSGVRMRSGPSTSATIVRKLNKGDRVDIVNYDDTISKNGDGYFLWIEASFGDSTGWIYSEFVDTDKIFYMQDMSEYIARDYNEETGRLFAVKSEVKLYDANLEPAATCRFGERLQLVASAGDDNDEFRRFFVPNTFAIKNHAMHNPVVVKFRNTRYLAENEDVSPKLITDRDCAYFTEVRYVLKKDGVIPEKGRNRIIPRFFLMRTGPSGKNALWSGEVTFAEESVTFDEITDFAIHNELLIMNTTNKLNTDGSFDYYIDQKTSIHDLAKDGFEPIDTIR